MGLKENIQIGAGNFFLKKEAGKKRNVIASNWLKAKYIGFIYRIDDERSEKHMKWHMSEIKKKHGQKQMFALGYYDDKVPLGGLNHGVNCDFITKKELNWFGKPTGKIVSDFLQQEFDILIDMTNYDCVPLQFVLNQSKSKFRVGKYNDKNEEFYDLMIAVQNNDVTHYMEQLDKYLTMLNV